MTRRVMALAVGGLVLVAGCGQAEVSTDDLEEQVATQLEREVGQAPRSVTCEDPLAAEAGAEERCVLTAPDGTRISLTVTTDSVDGEDVRFDIRVDETAMR